jgi:hypothetical protein
MKYTSIFSAVEGAERKTGSSQIGKPFETLRIPNYTDNRSENGTKNNMKFVIAA